MTRLMIAAVITLCASPALAHEGAHLHPHGLGAAWGLLVAVLALGAAAGAFALRRRGS